MTLIETRIFASVDGKIAEQIVQFSGVPGAACTATVVVDGVRIRLELENPAEQ